MLFAGLYLGQHDGSSALCIVDAQGTPHRVTVPVTRHGWVPGTFVQATEARTRYGPPARLEIRHLETFPPQTPYLSIAGVGCALLRRLDGPCWFGVDGTVCDLPVVDLLSEVGLNPIAVTITDGGTVVLGRDGVCCPQDELVTVVREAVQAVRLMVSGQLAESLQGEIANVLTEAISDGAPRASGQGRQDSRFLSLALACWLGSLYLALPEMDTPSEDTDMRHRVVAFPLAHLSHLAPR